MAGSPESVKAAREFVRRRLGDGHPALDDVTLLVSELVTNSVLHSRSRGGGRVAVAMADCRDVIHVDVVDAGGDAFQPVSGDMFNENGRGLMLVRELSRDWGTHTDEGGRVVWFQVAYQS
ncbi:ATP-binding protein [Sphaerisporangium sp. B11E5]|uniref:ATP-binding protein n=1 Tax=Sphaerisporangium sp. B11E5 TaxID=3153563 RepID=UPI00325F85FF